MKQIALMLAIEKTGTLGKAAHELSISQPAATKMLHELEQALGVKLFDRVGKSIQINETGSQTLLSFKGLLGTLEKLHGDIQEIKQGGYGRLYIGSIMAASPTYLTNALANLKHLRPKLNTVIDVGTNEQLMQRLDDGKLDVVIGRAPSSTLQYKFQALSEEPVSIICAINHPLISKRVHKFMDLKNFAWVLQPEGTPLRELVIKEFEFHHEILPAVGLLETSSTLITIHLVTKTNMVAVLPTSVAQEFANHGLLKIFQYKMRHKLSTYGSIIRLDRPLSTNTKTFIELLHQ
jgi:DNA-binding transcriptional LysR family regulator